MAEQSARILLEAEGFEDYGGWSPDTQFIDEMGSSYLLAHGYGIPVADARTIFRVQQDGTYHVWTRSKDWVPEYHPGRFELLINGSRVGGVLGANGKGWCWEEAGRVSLRAGTNEVRLHDLTGFEGRIDAIYLTTGDEVPPEEGKQVNRQWRRQLLGISDAAAAVSYYDVAVVGGGVAGCCAALSAARQGSSVVLIQDRPVLGGNASTEIGLGPKGAVTGEVKKLMKRTDDGDLVLVKEVLQEKRITVLLNEKVFAAKVHDGSILSVDARNTITNREQRIRAKIFIDASGTAALGRLAGAQYRSGREGRAEFHESLAPEKPDQLHHGNTVLFQMKEADHPVPVQEMPWATEVAKDFADLGGQMAGLGKDNQPGPSASGESERRSRTKMLGHAPQMIKSVASTHKFPADIINWMPASHFWEYGQDMDPIANAEEIRDHLTRALYGTYYNVKKAQPVKYANLEFAYIRIVPAQGEFYRLMGDYILNENDVRQHTAFPDAVVQNDGGFCVHYPGNTRYDFRLKSWTWDCRDFKPYDIPYRCLYSRNLHNLFMAGKIISVSRAVSTGIKLMANGAWHGLAVGTAASLCVRYGVTPKDLAREHLQELREDLRPYEKGI